MKLGMNQKDLLLLKLAFSILIVFLAFRFLIVPGIQSYQERIQEEQALAETRAEMQTAIDAAPLLAQSIEKKQQQLKEASASYYAQMENRQIDEIVTGLALKLGLFPMSLSIQEAVPAIPEAYRYAGAAVNWSGVQIQSESQQADTASPEENNIDSAEETNTVSAEENNTASLEDSHYILTGRVSVSLRGTQEQMFEFVDELEENYPAISIHAMQMNQRVFLDSVWNMTEELETVFELELYMYDGSAVE